MKPIAPPAPPPWGIHAGIIQKDETARAKFVDLGIEILKRVQKVAGYEDALLMRLELACCFSELPEQMAARAWVHICQHGVNDVYN